MKVKKKGALFTEFCYTDIFEDKKAFKSAKALYSSAFPAAEKIPFPVLRIACKNKKAKLLAVYGSGKFIGLLFLVLMEDIVSVFYFAVSEKLRQKGFGTKILADLKEIYSGKRIFLDIEKPDKRAGNNRIRLRRKAFYERNRFVPCGFDVTEFGVTYDILSFGGKISFDEYKKFMEFFAGKVLYRLVYKKMYE